MEIDNTHTVKRPKISGSGVAAHGHAPVSADAVTEAKIAAKAALIAARNAEHDQITNEFVPYFYGSLNGNTVEFNKMIRNFTEVSFNGTKIGGHVDASAEENAKNVISHLNTRISQGIIFEPKVFSFTSNGDRRINISVIGVCNTGNHFSHSILLAKSNDKSYWLPTFIELII